MKVEYSLEDKKKSRVKVQLVALMFVLVNLPSVELTTLDLLFLLYFKVLYVFL